MHAPPGDPPPRGPGDRLPLATRAGRWVVAVTVAGSSMAFLDATVVNVALPEIGHELGATTGALQWVLTGYLLALASLILVGGSLSDLLGRRRIFVAGAVLFAGASVLCGLAPTIALLVTARAAQGAGAALLTPGSLAIIEAAIAPDDRARAIGWWSGLTGVAAAVGPVLGGYLIATLSWRAIFLLNVPVAAFVVAGSARHLPESRADGATGRIDLLGAALTATGLGLVTWALGGGPDGGPLATAGLGAGIAALAAFLVVETRVAHPMLPLGLFRSSRFSAGNVVTFLVYAAIGGFFFLFASFLQISLGYSPVQAGAASLPLTLLMLGLSARSGALAQRIGPRVPLTAGPLGVAAGLLVIAGVGPGDPYLTRVMPGVVVLAAGLVTLVAPITATVLDAAGPARAGVGAGINNAVARIGGLAAVAALPPLVGLAGDDFFVPSAMAAGFRASMLICAGAAVLGGLVAAVTFRAAPAEPPARPGTTRPAYSCPVTAPPLRHPPVGPAPTSPPPAGPARGEPT